MYETSFGLFCRPFPSVPRATFYYPGSAIEYARQTLARCIERGEGVGIVIGPTGCGKSLLGQMLAEQFSNRMRLVHLPSGRLESRQALLQAILHGLRRPFRGMDAEEMRLALRDCLSHDEERLRPMLLLVDEAEGLPLRLLDELRMTTNLLAEGQPCSRLVLLGGPALEEKLTSPKLESLSQRIVTRCYLETFSRTETSECIRAQIAAASTAPRNLFSDDACEAVHQATDGVPRLVNQLCDHALILAYADGKESVDRGTVEEAWADLQQLPAPSGDSSNETQEPMIEFGGLDEERCSLELDAASVADTLDDRPAVGGMSALRLAPGYDDTTVWSGQQRDALDDAVDDLDTDFEPAGRITPEVDLVFRDPADLLNEDFQEEEVIVDRYGRSGSETAGEAAHPLRRQMEGLRGDLTAGTLQAGKRNFARLFSNLRRVAN